MAGNLLAFLICRRGMQSSLLYNRSILGVLSFLTVWCLISHFAAAQSASASDGAVGRALAIGVGKVNPAAYETTDLAELPACEDDARAMLKIAQMEGFTETNILLGSNATLAAVKAALEKAAVDTKAGEIFVVSFSGHGALVEDESGDEQYDQAWCLYDGQIIDDELAQCWARFPANSRIVVFSDSCHSGTIIKANQLATMSGRYIAKEIPHELQTMLTHKWGARWHSLPPGQSTMRNAKAAILTLSACQDYKKAYYIKGDKHSLFTKHLLKVWNNGSFQGNYNVFHNNIYPLVLSNAQELNLSQETNKMVDGKAIQELENQRPWKR